MIRTNIELDEKLLKAAMQLTGLKTKKATVNQALHDFVSRKKRKKLLDFKGGIEWAGDLDEMRKSRT